MIMDLNPRGRIPDTPPEFTYTGQYEFIDDGDGEWRIKFTTSGILEFTAPNSAGDADLFLVAGGQHGKPGTPRWSAYDGVGGDGGRGGECKTLKGIRLRRRRYQIDIGLSGQDTKITDLITGEVIALARTGEGAHGGAGAYYDSPGKDGGPGTPEFGEEGNRRYAGGGGGGFCPWAPGGQGKDGGGKFNENATGIGGGGGGGASFWQDATSGGAGYHGILIIRKHKEVKAA